jgi:hypothetical protein
MENVKIKLSDIKPNPGNPRVIKDARFASLLRSIQEFPKMLSLRPMVIDAEGYVLGGNMRLRALQELGYKEIPDDWVRRADDLTEEERQRFIIADNVGFGDWDWESLANDWDAEDLAAWGLEVPGWHGDEQNYSEKNKEIDTDELDGLMTISLKYNEDEYWKIREQLSKIAQTPEQAVWKLLGNE